MLEKDKEQEYKDDTTVTILLGVTDKERTQD